MNKAMALLLLTVPLLALSFACGGGGGSSSSGAPAAGGSISLSAGDNFFEYKGKKNPTIVVRAGSEVTFDLTNKGKAIHNLRIAGVDGSFNTGDDFVSKPNALNPGGKGSVTFKIDRAGSYKFHCDFHLESTGTITVES